MPKVHQVRRKKEIPYARGFKPASIKKQREAIGKDALLPEYDPAAYKGFQFFPSIPHPDSIDDWLAQYKERGQTYDQFVRETPWLSCRKMYDKPMNFNLSGKTILEKYPDGKIYLLPIGDFDQEHCVDFKDLTEFAQIYLGIPIVALPKVPLDLGNNGKITWTYDQLDKRTNSIRKMCHEVHTRYNSSTKHIQMRVHESLLKLRRMIPHDALCTMGLTMQDLYSDDPDLFVAGMAGGNLGVGLFSFFRYDPSLSYSTEDWYDVEKMDNVSQADRKTLILQRSCKLLVHEINHLLGLDHCIFYDCCMNGSGHLEEDFRQPIHLCPVDLRKLQTLVGFDILQRYRDLQKFYEKHGMDDEAEWVKRRVKAIEDRKK